mgnify:CR=1 FL=1
MTFVKTIVATLNAKYIHTCLALRYLKAYAEPEFSVEIVEFTIKDPAMNIVTELFSKQPDVIGFSCYIWNIEETIPIINMLKKINPDITIVLGGPEVSYDTEYWMKRLPEVDVIVIGEGEATFKDLLFALKNGQNLANVKGIAFRNDGEIIFTHPREKLDLNEIPSPFRFEEDLPHLSKRITYVETSRGCPFSCQFCLSSIETGVRYFDIERMKEELLFLMEHGAKTIKFVDRTFNIKRDYALEMFQFLIDNHREGCVFQFEITADIMRPEIIEFLNKHAPPGLFRFEIGVQSTNDETNRLIKRRQNFEKLSNIVTMIKNGGKIIQHLDLIAGLPKEDYASFCKTFNDVFALRPEELQLGFLKLLRGTGLRIQAKEFGYIYMDHAPYEILGNDVLSFSEIVKIKQVEDVLNKYWNDHRMDYTIEYLIDRCFETPFDFFQTFGSYWEQRGWARIGHQLEDLFTRLLEFLQHENIKELDIVFGLMKLDYLRNHKHKPRKIWWESTLTKEMRQTIFKEITKRNLLENAKFPLTEKNFFKHSVIETVPFDVEHLLKTNEIKRDASVLLVYYDPKQLTASIASLSMNALQI